MLAVVAVETALLVVLIVLVAGLLRSHAEILRRLGSQAEPLQAPADAPARLNVEGPAPPVSGTTLEGDAVTMAFEARTPTLLAFLTTGCSSCAGFWETLGEPRLPGQVSTVIVTRGTDRERPARLRSLAPAGVPVVMSSPAWEDYAVPGSPYFVLVDRQIRGEGVATTWQALASLVSDAIEDEQAATDGVARARGIDQTLAAAGIGADHPSLYPGGKP